MPGFRRMDKVPNALIKNLYGVTKEVNERTDKVFSDGLLALRELEMIGWLKECRPWREWIDTMKDYLKKF